MPVLTFAVAEHVADDVEGETHQAFASLGEALTNQDLSFRNIVKTRMFYTAKEDYPKMEAVRDGTYRPIFIDDDFPAATGLTTGGRGGASPRLTFQAVAAVGAKTVANSDRVARFWNGYWPPFSHLVQVDGVSFLAGQGAFDAEGIFTGGSFSEETATTLATFDAALEEVGKGAADIFALGVYLTPPAAAAYDEVMATVTDYIDRVGTQPLIVSTGISDLSQAGMRMELEAIAGPTGSEHRRVSRATATSAFGPLPSATHAIEAGGVIAASATGADVSTTAADMAAAATELGGVDGIPLVTVWCPSARRADDPGSMVREVLPDAIVSIVEMTLPEGIDAVTVELLGNARPSSAT